MADVTVYRGRLNHWSIYTGIVPEVPVQYVYYDDGTEYWRKGVRDGVYVIDHALNSIGFLGTENIDWENVWSIS